MGNGDPFSKRITCIICNGGIFMARKIKLIQGEINSELGALTAKSKIIPVPHIIQRLK
jgi:hypothetical protein